MGLALSCAVFASSCYMSLVPAQAVVRDNVGGMDTSIDSGSTDKDGNTATEGSAGKDEILKDFGAWVDGELVVGTMPNNGSVNGTLDTSNTSYTIPKGYHDGSGVINVMPESKTVNSLSSDGTGTVAATSGKVLDSVKIEVGKSVADRTALNAGETATISKGYVSDEITITANSLKNQTPGTATESKILANETAWVNGSKVTGTIPNSTVGKTALNAGESTTVSAGYIKNPITITASSLSGQTSGTATSADMLSGKTAWVNGSKVTGAIQSKSASTITPNTKDQTISAGQYLSGTQTIKGDANLVAGNILKGKSIFGVDGTVTAEVNSAAHTVPTGKTVVSAANILAGKTGWNGSSWVDGTMVDKSSTTTAASTVSEDGTNAKIQIPASGFYNKDNSYITVPVETLKNNVSSLNSSCYTPNSKPVIYKQATGVAGNPTTTFSITITEKGNYYISGSCGGRAGINDYYIAKNGTRLSLTEDCETYTYGGVYAKLYHVSNVIECSVGDIITYSATQTSASADCVVLDFIYVIKV